MTDWTEFRLTSGPHKGKTLGEIYEKDFDYIVDLISLTVRETDAITPGLYVAMSAFVETLEM